MVKGMRISKNTGKKLFCAVLCVTMMTTTGCFFDKSVSVQDAMQDVRSETDISEEDVADVREMDAKKIIMTVGDDKVSYGEVLFYMYQASKEYANTLGDGIWQVTMEDGNTFHNYAKEQILKEITELKIINLKAKSQGVVLTEDELDDVRQQASDFFRGVSEEDMEKYKFSDEVVEKIYEEHALANKMYDVTTGQVETNIPTEDAKQIRVQSMVVITNGVDKNGVKISLKDEEKKKALKKLKKLVKEAKETDSFFSVASANSDAKQVEYVFGKEDMPNEIGQEAFELKTGEYSPIFEKEDGYYVLYCVNDCDEDATQDKKEEIIQAKQDKVFEESYTEWSREYKVQLSTKIWKKINFYI